MADLSSLATVKAIVHQLETKLPKSFTSILLQLWEWTQVYTILFKEFNRFRVRLNSPPRTILLRTDIIQLVTMPSNIMQTILPLLTRASILIHHYELFNFCSDCSTLYCVMAFVQYNTTSSQCLVCNLTTARVVLLDNLNGLVCLLVS